jgi:hypothetical protein
MSSKSTSIGAAPVSPADAAPAAGKAEVLKANASGSGDFSGKRAIINIAAEPGEGGKNAVFIGVQGVGFLVPRGKNWDVPVEVANALRDANVTSWQRSEDEKSWDRIESPRFSFIAQGQSAPLVAENA